MSQAKIVLRSVVEGAAWGLLCGALYGFVLLVVVAGGDRGAALGEPEIWGVAVWFGVIIGLTAGLVAGSACGVVAVVALHRESWREAPEARRWRLAGAITSWVAVFTTVRLFLEGLAEFVGDPTWAVVILVAVVPAFFASLVGGWRMSPIVRGAVSDRLAPTSV